MPMVWGRPLRGHLRWRYLLVTEYGGNHPYTKVVRRSDDVARMRELAGERLRRWPQFPVAIVDQQTGSVDYLKGSDHHGNEET